MWGKGAHWRFPRGHRSWEPEGFVAMGMSDLTMILDVEKHLVAPLGSLTPFVPRPHVLGCYRLYHVFFLPACLASLFLDHFRGQNSQPFTSGHVRKFLRYDQNRWVSSACVSLDILPSVIRFIQYLFSLSFHLIFAALWAIKYHDISVVRLAGTNPVSFCYMY